MEEIKPKFSEILIGDLWKVKISEDLLHVI